MAEDQKTPAPSPSTGMFSFSFHSCLKLGITFLIGTLGGWLFAALSIPLPWMLGSMVATTCVALGGQSLERPIRLRLAMLAVLGVTLGSSFTPEILAKSAGWFGSLATMSGFVVIVSAISFLTIWKMVGLDRPTAFFSSVPAGVNDMVIVGAAMGGDERTIALIHGIRILLTVLTIPLFFRFTMGAVSADTAAGSLFEAIPIQDIGLLLLSGIAGFFLAKALRFPAPAILGPMIVSAACHLSGLTTAEPPLILVNTAQVVVGSAIGCRFVGVAIRKVGGTLVLAIVNTAFLIIVSGLVAWGFAAWFGAPFEALWLALAPGGIAEMLLVGAALDIEPAFVAAHHLFRVALVIMGAPLIYKFLIER